MEGTFICNTAEETFAIGEKLGSELCGGDVVLLYGGLGAGKTLMAKGILNALDYDVAEVISPSFTLVNIYKTRRFDVYHIDLWRLENNANPAAAVGLDEILADDDCVVIVEWADRLNKAPITRDAISVYIKGDGDEPRKIQIKGAKMVT